MPVTHYLFPKGQLYSIVWTFTGLAFAFTAARIVLRLKVYSRLMIDDGLVLLALVCLLASAITVSIFIPRTLTIEHVRLDHVQAPANFKDLENSYAKYQWAVAYLFFTGVWAIKGSFLAFYDDLTKRLKLYRRAWWIIIVYTILTYVGSLFAYAFLLGTNVTGVSKNEAIKYQFSADLTTDVLITLIPLTLALRSQLPAKKKLALAGIFGLTFLITMISICRFVLNSPSNGTPVPSWLEGWSVIEQGLSIIVSCFASFRIYIMKKKDPSEQSSSHGRYDFVNTFNARKLRGSSNKKSFAHLESQDAQISPDLRQRDSMDIELLDQAPKVTAQSPAASALQTSS